MKKLSETAPTLGKIMDLSGALQIVKGAEHDQNQRIDRG